MFKKSFIILAAIVSVTFMSLPVEAQNRGNSSRRRPPSTISPPRPTPRPNSTVRPQSSNLDFGEQLAVGVLSGLARGIGQGVAGGNNGYDRYNRPGGGYYNGRPGGYSSRSGYYNGRPGGYSNRSGYYGGSGYYNRPVSKLFV